MKRLLLMFALLLPAALAVGQYPLPTRHVTGMPDNLFGDWFGHCPSYIDPPPFLTDKAYFTMGSVMGSRADGLVASLGATGDTVRLAGLTAFTINKYRDALPEFHCGTCTWTEPETMYLCQGTPLTGLTLIDSVRWDTAAPYVLILPRNAQTQPGDNNSMFLYCLAFDALFPEPVSLSGVYSIVGTTRNNGMGIRYDTVYDDQGNEQLFGTHYYYTAPTIYKIYKEILMENACWPCIVDSMHKVYVYNFEDCSENDNRWVCYAKTAWGPFMAIVDTSHTPLGLVDPPEGEAPDGGLQFTLTPNPARGSVTVAATEAGRYNVTIYDASGHRVVSFPFEGRETRIDIRALPAGHYILTLDSPSLSGSRGFVKN